MITIGCDPGMASFGLAILAKEEAGLRLISVDVIETKKADKKVMRDLRVAADDQRRLHEFWDKISAVILSHKPNAMGVESYALFPGQLGGNSWKVAMSFQMSICCGWHHGLLPMVFRPGDLKHRLLGKNSGTKGEIETALCNKIEGMSGVMAKIAKTKREHAADAIGHAYLAMEEVEKMRAMYGASF